MTKKSSVSKDGNVNRKKFMSRVYEQRFLFIMSVPIIIWLIIFSYIPLAGWALAFINYKPGRALTANEFVGLKNFRLMFADSDFFRAIQNTLIKSSLGLVTGFVCAIGFAILLNELRSAKIKRVVQTVSYLPHFVSWVVVAGMVIQALSPSSGIINTLLLSLGVIKEPINFMANPNNFFAIITISNLWKGLGWSTIIYLSAMAGIDLELYEAAAVDGAGRLRRIWNITLPGISSTIIILLVMNLGGLLNAGFEDNLLLTNAMNSHVTEVLSLYTLKYGIRAGRYSFGTAVSVFISMISLTLVMIANYISRKLTDSGLF